MLKTIQEKQEYIKSLSDKATPHEIRRIIRKTFGVRKTRGNEIYRDIFDSNPNLHGYKVINTLEDRIEKAGEIIHTSNLSTLDEVLKEIKADLTKWKVASYSVESKKNAKTGLPCFNYRISFKRNEETLFNNVLDSFIGKAEAYSPKNFVFKSPNKESKYLYIINIEDLHMGKHAWGHETNWEDYDIKIAKRLYTEAVDDLMSKAPLNQIETVLIICGSDFFHCDSPKNETSAGTRLDADSRWAKMYDEGCSLMADTVEKLASKFKVEVMVVLGNHASVSEYCLGSYVKAFFRNHPNVNVNNKPSPRKYFGYGKTLIGFVHGDGVKDMGKDLPMVMFRENQETISNYKYFEILGGDKHTDRSDENKGVIVRTAPALCPPDFWHSAHNFIGNKRTAQALLYHRENGIESIIYSKPAEQEKEVK